MTIDPLVQDLAEAQGAFSADLVSGSAGASWRAYHATAERLSAVLAAAREVARRTADIRCDERSIVAAAGLLFDALEAADAELPR